MPMKNPPHPGEVIQELCIDPPGISVEEAARILGVSCNSLSQLLNGHNDISSEMALRLSKTFGGSAASWLRQQERYSQSQVGENTAPTKIDFRPELQGTKLQ